MVLSGTLKEFILADVFNLLTQQKITGRLVLTRGKLEGGIVFKDGIIVGADMGDESLPNKLFNLIAGIKRKSPEHVGQLFNANAGNLSLLTTNILERNLMTSKEMKRFAESCVEDICCSLLMWNQGSYRFNSLRSVATVACGFVTIPTEHIIMEGMRRVDEWGRMQEYISEDMIFVPAVKGNDSGPSDDLDVTTAPDEYVLSMLNGTNTVGSIKKSGCLCEYKVYESIHSLLQAQRITALHAKYTQTIQAALKRKNAEDSSALNGTFFGSLFSTAVAVVFVAFFLFCRIVLLPQTGGTPVAERSAGMTDATWAAKLLHQALTGEQATNLRTLKDAGLLTDRDF
jgi:hypothetical protein